MIEFPSTIRNRLHKHDTLRLSIKWACTLYRNYIRDVQSRIALRLGKCESFEEFNASNNGRSERRVSARCDGIRCGLMVQNRWNGRERERCKINPSCQVHSSEQRVKVSREKNPRIRVRYLPNRNTNTHDRTFDSERKDADFKAKSEIWFLPRVFVEVTEESRLSVTIREAYLPSNESGAGRKKAQVPSRKRINFPRKLKTISSECVRLLWHLYKTDGGSCELCNVLAGRACRQSALRAKANFRMVSRCDICCYYIDVNASRRQNWVSRCHDVENCCDARSRLGRWIMRVFRYTAVNDNFLSLPLLLLNLYIKSFFNLQWQWHNAGQKYYITLKKRK